MSNQKATYKASDNTLREIPIPQYEYKMTMKYSLYLQILKVYNCDNKCKVLFKDGETYERDKNYRLWECEVCDAVGSVEGGRFLECTCEFCNGIGIIAIPIATPILPSKEQAEDELWEDLFNCLYDECDMEALTFTTNQMTNKLKSKYSITRKPNDNG